MSFVYSFVVWPEERWGFDPAIFTLFELLKDRVEVVMTEQEFEHLRSGTSHHGLSLREVERTPYVEPELVQ